MILYHGSDKIINSPQYGIGNPYNDYGLGFYCTEDKELAKEWACPEARNGVANIYELDANNFKILDLQSNQYHVLNWIAILLKNRVFAKKTPIAKAAEKYIIEEFLPDTKGYDIICGYRADDSYFSYAKDFLNNAISVEQLEYAMRLGELGNQIVLVSKRAIESVSFINYEIADSKIYHAKRMQREQRARNQYLMNQENVFSNVQQGIYALEIVRNEVKNDDERLFRTICE